MFLAVAELVVGAFEFGYLEVFASAVSHCVLPSVLCFVLFVVVLTTSVGGVCCCLCLVFGLFLCCFGCVVVVVCVVVFGGLLELFRVVCA